MSSIAEDALPRRSRGREALQWIDYYARLALREIVGRTPIQSAMSDKRRQIADPTRDPLQTLLDQQHSGIYAKADRERTVILSEVQRPSRITRGAADAQADEILASAYQRDPGFYRSHRSLQSDRQPLAEAGPTIVHSPDAEFLRNFRSGPPATGR